MFKELILKFKKRINYFFAGVQSVETYFFKVKDSNSETTTFSYYGYDFIARLKGASDYDVLRQVIVLEEYKIPLSFLQNGVFEKKCIIDAGANIGATSMFFKVKFPEVNIFCIEPDAQNFSLLENNLKRFVENGSARLYNSGLTGIPGQNLMVHSNFGDGRDWAKAIEVINEDSNLKSITIDQIVESNSINVIDLLKIDIEGGEIFLLAEDTDLEFLKITRCIAIEIHFDTNFRKRINDLLISKNFILVVDGQTTIGINRNL